MSYDIAIEKAWNNLEGLTKESSHCVKFLADEYSVDIKNKEVLSLSCNVRAKEYYSILILHYLIKRLKGLPGFIGEWISFQEFDGGQGYYPAFRKRAIEPILRKYGSVPEKLFELIERFPAKSIQFGDVGIVLEAFENIPVLITLWRGDDEFGPEANMLFDKSIIDIFSTEDVAVLGGIIASLI